MFKNYIKITLRNLLADKVYSGINFTGLIIGISSFVLITLFVLNEYSFDSFHQNSSRIYRLNKIYTPNAGDKGKHCLSSGMMAHTIAGSYPEVESALRVFPWFPDFYLKKEENIFKISRFVAVDSNFFTFFDFKLLKGDSRTALAAPMSLVLSESTADRLFGSQDPLGKTITDINDRTYKITGVAEDAPQNSHLQYEVLLSWSSTVPGSGPFSMKWLNNWLAQAIYTYVTVKPNTDIASLQAKLQDIIKNYLPQKTDQYYLYLQPFEDIYLGSSDILYTRKIQQGNAYYVRLFLVTSLLILIIASFNYINLTNARSLRRVKEIGVRKSLGASRKQVIKQFLSESFLFSSIASLFAIILIYILLPYFNELTQKYFTIGWVNIIFWAFAVAVLISLVCGSYIAILLSGLNLTHILKGRLTARGSKSAVRKTTVAFQFAISFILISATVVIYNQMHFILNKDMGFQKEQMLVLEIGNTEISDHAAVFKQELLKNPAVVKAAVTGAVPGLGTYSAGILPQGKAAGEGWTSFIFRIDDFDLLDVFEMEMVQGRYFSEDFPYDTLNGVIINETLAGMLGWQDAVGKRLDIPGDFENGKVVGVIKDFNMNSLYQPVDPLVIFYQPTAQNMVLKLSSHNMTSVISFLERKWKTFAAGYPFEYRFLDEAFQKMYMSDLKMRDIFSLFSGIAVFISCLGLVGIISYASQLRLKEIGIRKVLGSSISNIVMLLSREFLVVVGIALITALPVSWYFMANWLQSFAYRIDLTVTLFLFSGLLAALPAVIVLISITFRAACTNPVETLRVD